MVSKTAVEVITGKKNIEVRPLSANKGYVIRQLLARHSHAQFIFCAGDDKTDEDMFRELLEEDVVKQGDVITCTIGSAKKKTLAKYHVHTPEQIVILLMRVGSMMSDRTAGLTL